MSELLRVYRIFDTVTETFWHSPNGKTVWNSPGAAKNAVNANPPKSMIDVSSRYSKYIKFSEQTRLEVRPFVLVEDI